MKMTQTRAPSELISYIGDVPVGAVNHAFSQNMKKAAVTDFPQNGRAASGLFKSGCEVDRLLFAEFTSVISPARKKVFIKMMFLSPGVPAL